MIRGSALTISSWLLRLTIVLLAVGRPTFATEPFGNASNGTDLRTDSFFSRPLTVLESIIANVGSRASEVAALSEFPGTSYRLDKSLGSFSEGGAGYDSQSGRTVLYLELRVEYMSDPWREVCLGRLKQYLGSFYFPARSYDDSVRLRMMNPYFGHITETDPVNAENAIDKFLNSIVVRVNFNVVVGKKLEWVRSCRLDNETGKVAYDEQRYPDK